MVRQWQSSDHAHSASFFVGFLFFVCFLAFFCLVFDFLLLFFPFAFVLLSVLLFVCMCLLVVGSLPPCPSVPEMCSECYMKPCLVTFV